MGTSGPQDGLQADLVFEGGGVKGIGLAGAFRELDARGYQPQCVAGTSAGAITAALVAVGYSGAELEEIVLRDMHFKAFADNNGLNHFGVLGEALRFSRSHGLHSGNYFLGWMTERLAAKGITTFGELRDPGSESGGQRAYKLQVIASDLTGRSMLILPRDAAQLGLDPDKLEIARAVRMSMSIPVFFEPVLVTPRAGDAEHVIVDGGLLSNFPVWLFDCPADQPPGFPTFGMLLVAPKQDAPLLPDSADPDAGLQGISTDAQYLHALADTMMEAHDRFYVEQANYARTIPIPTLGVKTTEFNIDPARAQALFDSGRGAARRFLDSWDFEAYKAQFRTGAKPSGRLAGVT